MLFFKMKYLLVWIATTLSVITLAVVFYLRFDA